MEPNKSFGSRFRPLSGAIKLVHDGLLLSLAVLGAVWSLEIHADLGIVIFKEQFLALIFMIGMTAVFMSVPASIKAGDGPTRSQSGTAPATVIELISDLGATQTPEATASPAGRRGKASEAE